MSKEITIKVGFEGHYKDIQVNIGDNDVPPYQPSDKLKVVGKKDNRVDALAKVTGRAKYTYDKNPKGCLFGKILRSPHANANVKSIDISKAQSMPGVKAVVSYDKILRLKSIRYAGQGIAAVAAETKEQAKAALAAIKVEYEVLPFCVNRKAAQEEFAPQVGRGKNANVERVSPRVPRSRRGELNEEQAKRVEEEISQKEKEANELFAKAKYVVEADFETSVQTHSPLETHGVVCDWREGKLYCDVSTQATFGVLRELTSNWGTVKAEEAEVNCEYVGGGFGGKFSLGSEGVAGAMLAKEAGKPVKLMLDRYEEHTDAGNRPDSLQKLRMGVNEEGQVTAYRVRSWGTPGPGTRGAGANNDVIYDVGFMDKVEYGVRTNCGGSRALRAPGFPQGVFALEGIMELAARKMSMDSIEFRKKNDFHPIRVVQYDMARKKIGWKAGEKAKASSDPAIKRGFGVGSALWFAAGGGGAAVLVRIHKNGQVEVRNGGQDIGTGTRTIMGMVVAEELGIELKDVQTFIGNTKDPRCPASGGSTTAPSLTPAARLAGVQAREQLLDEIADKIGVPADKLGLVGGQVVRTDGEAMPKSVSFKQACAMLVDDHIEILTNRPTVGRRRANYAGFSNTNAGVQCAEVEVDTETGVVKVIKVVAVQDAGKLINPKTAESQVRGAVIQGVSYALFERRIMDDQLGHMMNANFEEYKIAGSMDTPEIEVEMFDVYMGRNNTNVMGLGEPPIVPTAAAIANAVHDAIGVPVTSLPITPKKVLTALARKERG